MIHFWLKLSSTPQQFPNKQKTIWHCFFGQVLLHPFHTLYIVVFKATTPNNDPNNYCRLQIVNLLLQRFFSLNPLL